mgnify:CR=1 FL=1
MANQRLHFQVNFTKANRRTVSAVFAAANEDEALAAVWAGGLFKLPLRQSGFVFFKGGFAWQFPVVVERELSGGVERSNCAQGFLSVATTDFKLVYIKLNEGTRSLVVKTADGDYIFDFNLAVPEEDVLLLESLIRNYFTRGLRADDLSERDESYSMRFTWLAFLDFVKKMPGDIKLAWQNVFGREAWATRKEARKNERKVKAASKEAKRSEKRAKKSSAKAEREAAFERAKQNASAAADNAESTSAQAERKEGDGDAFSGAQTAKNPDSDSTEFDWEAYGEERAREAKKKRVGFLRHAADLCADWLFVAAIVIRLKPALLSNYIWLKSLENFGQRFPNVADFSLQTVPDDIRYVSIALFIQLMFVFFVLKTVVILSCKNSRRIVSVMLLVMLGVVIFLVGSKFLVFFILSLLILLTLQFSMEFERSVIKIKTFVFLLGSAFGYVATCFILNPEIAREVMDLLSLKVTWW